MTLYLSGRLLQAIAASPESRTALARAVAAVVGRSGSHVDGFLIAGTPIAVDADGHHPIVSAVCEHIGFAVEDAFSTTPPRNDAAEAAVERRFRAALARIRAERRRLTPEDCTARRGSTIPLRRDDAA